MSEELYKDKVFESKDACKTYMEALCIEHFFGKKHDDNKKRVYRVSCVADECDFMVRFVPKSRDLRNEAARVEGQREGSRSTGWHASRGHQAHAIVLGESGEEGRTRQLSNSEPVYRSVTTRSDQNIRPTNAM